VYDGGVALPLKPKGENMPTKKTRTSKKKLAPGKKQQKVKPLKDFHFTKPVDKPSANLF
jgi:hypothetical protein